MFVPQQVNKVLSKRTGLAANTSAASSLEKMAVQFFGLLMLSRRKNSMQKRCIVELSKNEH